MKIDTTFVELLELIFVGTYLSKMEKIPVLKKAISKIDLLKFLFRVMWESEELETKRYIFVSKPLNEAGKEIWTWKNSLENKTPPAGGEK